MKRAPRSRQRHDLYAKYHDYDSEISDLLGECGAMTAAIADMESRAWADAEVKEASGVACLTGGDCPLGEAGTAVLHEPGEGDIAARQAILDDFVLKRWGERCGADCATRWNDTAGKAAGLVVPVN